MWTFHQEGIVCMLSVLNYLGYFAWLLHGLFLLLLQAAVMYMYSSCHVHVQYIYYCTYTSNCTYISIERCLLVLYRVGTFL